jgi:DNA-binding NarL/FixJ family response regulator
MNSNSLLLQNIQKILVIDDHEVTLRGSLEILKSQYPQAELLTAGTAEEALSQVAQHQPDGVVIDLSLPSTVGETAHIETGLQLLRSLMRQYPTLNLMVQSTYVNALVRIKHEIDAHQGGFTVADKGLSSREMLLRVDWALQGLTHTKDIRAIQKGLEVQPEWLSVLTLAFQQGLQDKAIAKQLQVTERTVRHYWAKIQDVLEIYPEDSKKDGKNLRILTEIRAREAGLID